MTIERFDGFGESRKKGVSLVKALRGHRTLTRVRPEQVVWPNGRITDRSTEVKERDEKKFAQAVLITGPDSICSYDLPGSPSPFPSYTDWVGNQINNFSRRFPEYGLRYTPDK